MAAAPIRSTRDGWSAFRTSRTRTQLPREPTEPAPSTSAPHGHSIHLDGLEPTNSNAAPRAIVVHGAWYVSQDIVGRTGMLGRSQGCFAVADASLAEIMTRLGPGRMIYAGGTVPAAR